MNPEIDVIPSTSRDRQEWHLAPRRSNAWAGVVGFLTGRGYTSSRIAEIVGDGTTRETVCGVWRRWGLTQGQIRANDAVTVPLSRYEIRMLNQRARELGISPQEWLRRVAACAIRYDLYGAVTDGQYEADYLRPDK